MTTQLTVTIEENVLKSAKQYAETKGSSLSEIIENYLKRIALRNKPQTDNFSPSIKELLGSVMLPENFEYKKELTNELTKKHFDK